MTYLFCFLGVLFAVYATAYCGIPADVRELIGENCRDSSGRPRARYVIRECLAVFGFYAQFLFIVLPLACVFGFACVAIDRHIRLDLIGSGLSQFHWDTEIWQQNLSSAPNNVKEDTKNYHLSQGGTTSSARQMMRFLWAIVPVAFGASFFGVIMCLRLMSRSYRAALERFVQRGVATDLRRVRRRYLRSCAQSKMIAEQDEQPRADRPRRVIV